MTKTNLYLFALLLISFHGKSSNEFAQIDLPRSDLTITDLEMVNAQLWVATNDGIWVLDGNGDDITPFDQSALASTNITCLQHDDQQVWAATKDGQLLAWSDNKWTSHDVPQGTYDYLSHISIYNDELYLGTNNGKVFIGTTGAGFEEKNYAIGTLGEITHIGLTSHRTITVLSTNGVLLDFTQQSTILPIKAENTFLPSNNVISGYMYEDRSYDCTDKGLYIADFSNPGPPSIELVTTLPSNVVRSACVSTHSEWIATDGGLALRENGEWRNFTSSNSNLFEDEVTHVVLNQSNKLWFATASGKIGKQTGALSVRTLNAGYADIQVYPSVFSNELRINVNSSANEPLVLNLYHLDGSLAQRFQVTGATEERLVNVQELPSGVYILRAAGINSSRAIRLVKL